MKFLRRSRQSEQQKPVPYSLVDIGRDTVKSVVVLQLSGAGELQIVGHGMAPTNGHDITGGRIEANAVTASVNSALVQAEDSTERFIGHKIVPDEVVFSLAGRATIGKLFTVRQTRPKPTEPISAKELESLRARAERLVRQGLASLPVEGGQWQALAVNDAGLFIDKHLVLDAQGLTGREISLSMFGVAGHAATLRAIQVLAERLDVDIANIVASTQALATITPHTEAILLDIGLSGTDICLIRNNALVATAWVPFGGGFLTQALAQATDATPERAAALKQALAAGTLKESEAERVNAYLDGPRQRWYEAIMEALVKLASQTEPLEPRARISQPERYAPLDQPHLADVGRPLPRQIYLTGGGSLAPGLDKLLRANSTPFQGAPEVVRLGRRPPPAMKDLTDSIDYDFFSLTLSLAAGLPAPV